MSDLSLSGKLPAGDRNGLPSVLTELLDDPKTPRLAVVLFNVSTVKKNVDTGDQVPVIRLLGIEPVTPSDDAKILDAIVRRSVERRTGKEELPFELEQAVEDAMNGKTGETGTRADGEPDE